MERPNKKAGRDPETRARVRRRQIVISPSGATNRRAVVRSSPPVSCRSWPFLRAAGHAGSVATRISAMYSRPNGSAQPVPGEFLSFDV